MKTVTKVLQVNRFECEGCGATHAKSTKIDTCYLTGEEICSRCGISVNIVNPEIYTDIPECIDLGYSTVMVSKQKLSKKVNDEYYQDTYEDMMKKLQQEYLKQAKELTSAFMQGKLEELK